MKQEIRSLQYLLKDNGYRLTHPREIIIKFFLENKNEHYTPDEVFQLIKHQGVSLPSVYRGLEVLRKIGILKNLQLNGHSVYELNIYNKKSLHIHFQCSQCGNIQEFDDWELVKLILQQKEYIENHKHLLVDDITIIMKGICHSCRK